jgi:hypothetical protein
MVERDVERKYVSLLPSSLHMIPTRPAHRVTLYGERNILGQISLKLIVLDGPLLALYGCLLISGSVGSLRASRFAESIGGELVRSRLPPEGSCRGSCIDAVSGRCRSEIFPARCCSGYGRSAVTSSLGRVNIECRPALSVTQEQRCYFSLGFAASLANRSARNRS